MMEHENGYSLLVVKTGLCFKDSLMQNNKPLKTLSLHFPSININNVEQALLLGKYFTKFLKTIKCLESLQVMFLKGFKKALLK